MPHINYFDLGLWEDAYELGMMVNNILPTFQNITYTVYGIDAHPLYCQKIQTKYESNPNVKIFNFAIADGKGETKLYLDKTNGLGNSIFSTKNNVNVDRYLVVPTNTFSNWLVENSISLDNALNILKVNIEGAELLLWRNFRGANLRPKFHIFCGHLSHDIYKVAELKNQIDDYHALMSELNIKLDYFCHTNRDVSLNTITNLIKTKLTTI